MSERRVGSKVKRSQHTGGKGTMIVDGYGEPKARLHQMSTVMADLGEGYSGLPRQPDLLRRVLDSLPESIVVFDETGRVVATNAQLDALLGLPEVLPAAYSVAALGERLAVLCREESGGAPDGSVDSRGASEAVDTVHLHLKDGRTFERRQVVSMDGAPLCVWTFRQLTAEEAPGMEDNEAAPDAAEAMAEEERLLYIVGHELRGPLTALRMAAGVIMRKGLLDGVAARQLKIVDQAERQLSRLVSQLFDVGAIKSGHWTMELEPVDICEVAREVVLRISADPLRRDTTPIRLETSQPCVIGHWDRSRLDQVINNLVTNALKYGQGRPVEVRLVAGDGGVSLEVTDHGIGIAESMQSLIFQPFKRAPGVQRVSGGLGLGLYIVRTIVKNLGGSIRLASAPDQGTTVVVSLPVSPPVP